MFSSAFSSAFAGRAVAGYIGPVMAQAALADGAAARASGSGLLIGGKRLIGPAGKVYAFKSPASAATWAENAKGAELRARALVAGDPVKLAAFIERKRAALAVIADRVTAAALKVPDDGRRAALLAEAGFCLVKWG